METRDLLEDLKVVCELHGEMEWSEEAEQLLVSWYEAGMQPVPEHSKLKHYVPRRILTTMKLCMISCAARGNSMLIDETDVARARDWLLEIEGLMPDVFKDMSGPSDMQLIQDMHYYAWQIYAAGGNKPIHRSKIDLFLAARTPSYNREHIIKTCLSCKILKEAGPDFYIPGERNTLVME